MQMKHSLIGLGLIAGLAACSTAQENPNYKYSSKYEGQEDVRMVANSGQNAVQNASYYHDATPVTAGAEYDRQRDFTNSAPSSAATSSQTIYTSQSHTYSQGAQTYQTTPSATLPSYQVQASSQTSPYQTAPSQTVTSGAAAPTDTAYAGQSVEGTPGYGVYIPETTTQDMTPYTAPTQSVVAANTSISGASEYHDIDRFQSVPTIAAPMPMPSTQVFSTGSYIVKQGDTVYSLSRQLCVGVEDLKLSNGLGSNYGIQIGQTLTLPASQC